MCNKAKQHVEEEYDDLEGCNFSIYDKELDLFFKDGGNDKTN